MGGILRPKNLNLHRKDAKAQREREGNAKEITQDGIQ